MLNAVTANFLGDNLQCWMQIQVGKGPWASEVSGIVKIGQTMTMVLAIKDDENKFDMLVRNCANNCRISSPLFPVSAYPRNVTCRYRVVFDRSDFQVVLGGQPGDRYDLALHPHCQADRLIVYEKTSGGNHHQYQQVAKFCGRGTFPKVYY